FEPTLITVDLVKPAPIRKSVRTNVRFADISIHCPGPFKIGTNVTVAAAAKNPRMNQGRFARAPESASIPPPLRTPAIARVNGTIQSAGGGWIVVPTSTAREPYCSVAPTTELVSWIASAAHAPNCVSLKANKCPTGGKMTNATALRKNTTARATEISCGFA